MNGHRSERAAADVSGNVNGNGLRPGTVVILLENLPVQRDRRVWRQARALVEVGVPVTVICPALDASWADRRREKVRIVDGVEIRTFTAAKERSGVVGFVWEYGLAWVQMAWILLRLHRSPGVIGVQAATRPTSSSPWRGGPVGATSRSSSINMTSAPSCS